MKLILPLFFLLSLQVSAASFQRTLDVMQGFNLNNNVQRPIGFISKLTIAGYEFETDLSVKDPLDPPSTFDAVSVLSYIGWDMSQDDAVLLSGQVSSANQMIIKMLSFTEVEDLSVEADISVFEYNGREFKMGVSDSPSSEFPYPQNYNFQIEILPAIYQYLELCAYGKCTTKSWGRKA